MAPSLRSPLQTKQVDRLDKLRFEPMVIPVLRELQAAGFKLIMVTNQDGLGTASLPLENFQPPQDLMMHIFESQGVHWADVLICPHFPHEDCTCRKPKLGLVKPLLQAGKLDHANSYVIGDRITDVQLAENMGITGIQYNPVSCNWNHIRDRLLGQGRTATVIRNTKETEIRLPSIWIAAAATRSAPASASSIICWIRLRPMLVSACSWP